VAHRERDLQHPAPQLPAPERRDVGEGDLLGGCPGRGAAPAAHNRPKPIGYTWSYLACKICPYLAASTAARRLQCTIDPKQLHTVI
jgi:hypothetical protein